MWSLSSTRSAHYPASLSTELGVVFLPQYLWVSPPPNKQHISSFLSESKSILSRTLGLPLSHREGGLAGQLLVHTIASASRWGRAVAGQAPQQSAAFAPRPCRPTAWEMSSVLALPGCAPHMPSLLSAYQGEGIPGETQLRPCVLSSSMQRRGPNCLGKAWLPCSRAVMMSFGWAFWAESSSRCTDSG